MRFKKIPLYFVFLIIAVVLILDQWYLWGVPFQIEDLHHEAYVIALLLGAVILYVRR